MPLYSNVLAQTSIASVSRLLRESLRQLDELGLSIPASHVDHALALLPTADDRKLAETLRVEDELMIEQRNKTRMH
jgi:hypothetical protein